LPSFGAESSVFQFTVQKFKDEDMQNYNFAYFLYGCETWSLTFREELGLRVLRIFGPKKGEATRKVEKTTLCGAKSSVLLTTIVRVFTWRKRDERGM
jgi:hypothetical protein